MNSDTTGNRNRFPNREGNSQSFFAVTLRGHTDMAILCRTADIFIADETCGPRVAGLVRRLGPNPVVTNRMPRVPQGTPGYSTARLVRDSSDLPSRSGRPDAAVQIVTPSRESFPRHNNIYSMDRAAGGRPYVVEPDVPLESYGYSHRQTTVDQSTGSARSRSVFTFPPSRRYEDEEGSMSPGDRRSRSPRDRDGRPYRDR
jgi:hypothetical protein